MASIACCSVSKILVVWTREFFANSITRSRSYMMALLAKITAITAENAAVSLREIRKFAKADNRSSEALGRPKGVNNYTPPAYRSGLAVDLCQKPTSILATRNDGKDNRRPRYLGGRSGQRRASGSKIGRASRQTTPYICRTAQDGRKWTPAQPWNYPRELT